MVVEFRWIKVGESRLQIQRTQGNIIIYVSYSSIVLPISQDPVLQGGACCAYALQSAIERMDRCGLIMQPEDAIFVGNQFQECLLHWQGMKTICDDADLPRWGMRPKHHVLEHMGESCKRNCINPRHLSCFQDESYLGQIKQIACKCHSTTALYRVYQRLIIGLAQRFKNSRGKKKKTLPTCKRTFSSLLGVDGAPPHA